MGHPYGEHRQSKVEHSRVGHITRGYASGGTVHSDAAEDRKMVKGMVKPDSLLKATGGKVKHRADRPHRASGGRLKGGKGTNVNVIIAPQGAPAAGGPPLAGVAGGPPPPMPPRPMPAMPPAGGPPGAGMPPGMPPGIRNAGGRAYASGGGVKSGPGWVESEKFKTQVQHDPGKNDLKDMGRGKPVTYKRGGAVGRDSDAGGLALKVPGRREKASHARAIVGEDEGYEKRARGGAVEAPAKMGPKMDGGAGGGLGRLEKAQRARRDYKEA